MRKILAAVIICAMLLSLAPSVALGASAYTAYVNNPSMSDRLHLRVSPSTDAESLGKYYNGTRVSVLEQASDGWVKARVGDSSSSLTGYMMKKYLTTKPDESFMSAMPLYIATDKSVKTYKQPSFSSGTKSIKKGTHIYIMGFSPEWCHMLVRVKGESDYTCFLPAELTGLQNGMHVFVMNPDKNDRLHLRVKPDKAAKSLGKYYNGSQGDVLWQTLDGEWSYVSLYGRNGYMKSDYLCFMGETNNTYYGVVKASMLKSAPLLGDPSASGKRILTLDKGTEVEVFGVLEDWLHIRLNGTMGFVSKNAVDYKE